METKIIKREDVTEVISLVKKMKNKAEEFSNVVSEESDVKKNYEDEFAKIFKYMTRGISKKMVNTKISLSSKEYSGKYDVYFVPSGVKVLYEGTWRKLPVDMGGRELRALFSDEAFEKVIKYANKNAPNYVDILLKLKEMHKTLEKIKVKEYTGKDYKEKVNFEIIISDYGEDPKMVKITELDYDFSYGSVVMHDKGGEDYDILEQDWDVFILCPDAVVLMTESIKKNIKEFSAAVIDTKKKRFAEYDALAQEFRTIMRL